MNKSFTFYLSILLTVFLLNLINCNCGGSGTTQVGNTSPGPNTVTVSKVSEAKTVTVTIPITVIGEDENDLAGVTVDVLVNEAEYASDINAINYYETDSESVVYEILNINQGDVISIIIILADGSYETYEAIANILTEAEASLEDSGTNYEGQSEQAEINNEVTQIANALCDVVSDCVSGLDSALCVYGLMLLDDEATYLGVASEANMSLEELEQAVEDNTYAANADNYNQCLSDIGDITCSQVTSAYSIYNPTDFSGLDNLIPAGDDSCEGVF